MRRARRGQRSVVDSAARWWGDAAHTQGSGFGQEAGTWHFRTTILPREADFGEVLERLAKFHAWFMDTCVDARGFVCCASRARAAPRRYRGPGKV